MQESTSARLQRIMAERNLKQTDIIQLAQPYCRQYGVKLGKSDMSQFVNGKVVPGQWKLTILGLALNVSEAWLMGLDVPMERHENAKPPTPEDEDGRINLSELDNVTAETIELLLALPEEKQQDAGSYIRYLAKTEDL